MPQSQPSPYAQASAGAYLRQGLTPFFRLPMADLGKRGPAAYEGADAVVLGVPHDAGVTYRPGARFAPWEVRRVSALLQTFHPEHGVDVFGMLRAVDGGNVAFPPFHASAMRELVQAEIASVAAHGAAPFVVGGDHSITLPVLRALHAKHGPLAVVHVDAHLDTSSSEVWGEPFHHGTPIRHALKEGLIAPNGLHQVGIRASWGYADEGSFADSFGARRHDMRALEDRGVRAIAEEIRTSVGDLPVYVTFDVDGVDPAYAPGTGTPVPGGMTSREAIRLLRSLVGVRLVGMDVVEVSPGLDHADVTAHLAAQLLFEGLALRAKKKV
jgi:agmatinase